MLTTKTLKNGLLAATMFGAFAVATSGAQAETIFFNPGASNGGGNTNFLTALIGPGAADLDANTAVDQFNWAAVNRTTSGAPVFGSNHQQWRIAPTSGGDNVLDSGETFSEFFDFHLTTVLNTGGSEAYGSTLALGNPGTPFPTHVFMTADLSGNVVSSGADPINDLELQYTVANFKMFFDVDGDKNTDGTAATDNILIAEFGATVREGSAESGSNNILDLLWDVSWDTALEGVFFLDEAGTKDVTANDLDGVDGNGLKDVLNDAGQEGRFFKLTQQAVRLGNPGSDGAGLIVASQGDATGTSVINSVPEPGTLALFGLGLLGLGVASRRRQSSKL